MREEHKVNIVTAAEVARGVCRHLRQRDYAPMTEFPLGNGRRADIAAVNKAGRIVIVEIKVSPADFRGDGKWPLYLDYCDYFYFAAPEGFPHRVFDEAASLPGRTGVMAADRFQAAVLRPAGENKLSAARRRAETLRFARKAAARLHCHLDPDFSQGWLG